MSEVPTQGSLAPAAGPHKSFLSRVVGVFFSPGETFDDIRRKPTILAPLGILFVSFMLMNVLIAPIAGPEQADLLENSSRLQSLTSEQREEILDPMRDPSPARIWLGAAAAPVAILLAILIYALILWGMGHLLGGEPKYKGVLSMLLFASMIAPVLATLVRLPLILAKESVFEVTISPATFMPNLEATSSLFLFLTIFFDLFYIWWVVVAGIGFSRVAKVSPTAAVATVALLFIIRSTLLYFITALSFG